MWALIDGVAGIILGCAVSLIILAIRISASRAVVTWRMQPEQVRAQARHDKETGKILA